MRAHTIPPAPYTPAYYRRCDENQRVTVWYFGHPEVLDPLLEGLGAIRKEAARVDYAEQLRKAVDVPEGAGKLTKARAEERRKKLDELEDATLEAWNAQEHQRYAELLADVVHRFTIAGEEVPWPTTLTDRIALLRSMPRIAMRQIVAGIAAEAYDAEELGKS